MTKLKRLEPLYDRECWELAVHFLADEPIPDDKREGMTRDLAIHIQKSVEDWLMTP